MRAHWAGPDELEPGPITVVTHSGTAYFSFVSIDPRLRFNLIVSPGQELATTAADYLDYALTLPAPGWWGCSSRPCAIQPVFSPLWIPRGREKYRLSR